MGNVIFVMRLHISGCLLCFVAATPAALVGQTVEMPPAVRAVVSEYCAPCHDEQTAMGDVNLDFASLDLGDPEILGRWSDAFVRVDRDKMPPVDEPRPSDVQRKLLLDWLDQELTEHSAIGGAPIRRLNRREIENSLQAIFTIPDFQLPAGFPADNESHGFDTVAESLVISPSHLEAYRDTATVVADYMFPQRRAQPPSQTFKFGINDFSISYSSGAVANGAMRLASTGILSRNGVWLSRYEAKDSGKYRVSVDLSSMNPTHGETPEFQLQANSLTGKSKTRSLATFQVKPGAVRTFSVEVELFRGETLVFTYSNSPLNYGDKKKFTQFLRELFEKEPALASAWLQLEKANEETGNRRGVPRGGNGWLRLKQVVAEHADATISDEDLEALAKDAGKANTASGETIVYKYFEEGPNIGVHAAVIEGPLRIIEDESERTRRLAKRRFVKRFFGENEGDLRGFFQRYLTQVFRRPATDVEVNRYLAIVESEREAGYSRDEGLHLAIRTSLLSSAFLYKESEKSGLLPPFELASRLSYFLTSGPPDEQLFARASDGSLNRSQVLREEAGRLMTSKSDVFANDFTALWLQTRLLDTIIPDKSLLKNYGDGYRQTLKDEVVLTFQEILLQNQPLTQFINPDFLYTNATIGWEIYGLEEFASTAKTPGPKRPLAKLQRLEIPRDSRSGGLLSMPAVMLATANGVDTQPVLRGVWMLDNIIGRAPLEPPQSVPALSPDLNGDMTPKERLAVHMSDESCASCHAEIDPVGFVFENYDAVGRWRETYPSKAGKAAQPVDATGMLPDGTSLQSVIDLKQWLVEHPEHFSNCLAEKLMIYATGRAMNYREKRMLESIVEENIAKGNRFGDLLLDLVESDVFRHR